MSTQSHIDKVNMTPNLMEYPHHVGAPKIVPTDLTPFKQNGTDKANKIFNRRYQEIYHLYEKKDGTKFLSIIEPTLWNQKYLYSTVLNSDMTWSQVE